MGTRGLYAYRRRGRYRIFYSHFDSYPGGLGTHLVSQIPSNQAAFAKWKADMEKSLDESYAAYLEGKKLVPTAFTPVHVQAQPAMQMISLPEETMTEKEQSQNASSDDNWSDFPPENDTFIEWTYVFDFDRDAFSIDGLAHFRLSNFPQNWIDHLELDENGSRCMPTKLDPAHLVWDIYPGPPSIDETLIHIYDRSQPSIVEPPTPTSSIIATLLRRAQSDLNIGCNSAFSLFGKEYTPKDVQMQKLVYVLVKLSTWRAVSFVEATARDWWVENLVGSILQTAQFPTDAEYYIPIGLNDEKALISLATHLDNDMVLKMAVGNVINLIPDQEKTIACIVSLQHAVIVHVDKTSSSPKVDHTKPLELFSPHRRRVEPGEGREALIAALSPTEYRLDTIPNPSVLPPELNEHVFKELVLIPGGIKAIPEFAAACKLFKAIVNKRLFQLPGLTLLNYPTWLKGAIYGIDDKDRIELYNFGDESYPINYSDGEAKHFWTLIDRLSFGVGHMTLNRIDVDRLRGRNVASRKPTTQDESGDAEAST